MHHTFTPQQLLQAAARWRDTRTRVEGTTATSRSATSYSVASCVGLSSLRTSGAARTDETPANAAPGNATGNAIAAVVGDEKVSPGTPLSLCPEGSVMALRLNAMLPAPLELAALLGTLATGRDLLILSHRLSPEENTELITRAHATLVPQHPTDPALNNLCEPTPFAPVKESTIALPSHLPEVGASRFFPEKVNVLLATSGSSGPPKLVVLRLSRMLHAAQSQAKALGITHESRLLLSLSPSHIGGLQILFRALVTGATLVIPNSLTRDSLSEVLRHGEITHASLVSAQLSFLLDSLPHDPPLLKPFPHLHMLLLGGAPTSLTLIKKAHAAGLPIATSYGMTETCALTSLNLTPHQTEAQDVGHPLPEARIEIRLPSGEMTTTPERSGRVAIASPFLFSGYLHKGGKYESCHTEVFLTADEGRIASGGGLIIMGRADQVIISGGLKISPSDLETAARSHPNVVDAVVTGIPHPVWGERPGLVVVASQGIEVELDNLLRRTLPKEKQPDQIVVVPELPRTEIGKINYQEVRRLLQEARMCGDVKEQGGDIEEQ